MLSVTEDTITGVGTASWNSRTGFVQPRVFTVDDYAVGNESARSLSVMLLSEIPANNSPHPAFIWKDLVVISKSVETISGSQFRVTCTYGKPESNGLDQEPSLDPAKATLSITSTLVETENEFDVDDKQIFTSHFDDKDGNPKPVFGSVRDHAVSMVLRFERMELDTPVDKAAKHLNTLNSNILFSNNGPRTWLCSELSGTTNGARLEGTLIYRVVYEFMRSPKADENNVPLPWDVTIVEIDPETGTFVDTPLIDRGKKVIKIKGESNFGLLDLTI